MFYKLVCPANGRFAACRPYKPSYIAAGHDDCPLCGRHMGGRYWEHPRTLEIEGTRFPDFLFPTPYPAVSERFVALYKASGLKGILGFEEIEHYRIRKTAARSDKYYTLTVMRSRVSINYQESGIDFGKGGHEHFCPLCDPQSRTIDRIKRLALNEEGYAGEDIFKLYATGNALYLSERFVDFVKKNRLTNLGLCPLDDFEKRMVL